MPKPYPSLAAAFAAHPECIGMEVTEYQTYGIPSFDFELAFETDEDIEFREISVKTKDSDLLLQEILGQKHWRVISLRPWENHGDLTRQLTARLSNFPQLRQLTIRYNNNRFAWLEKKDFAFSLEGLDCLEEIELEGVAIDFQKPLPSVRKFELSCTGTKIAGEIAEILSFLNPHQLVSLRLSENQLTELPADIGNFVLLERLDLSQNELIALPVQVMQLEKLKQVSLYRNPILKQTELTEKNLLKTIKQCTVQQFPMPLRELALNLVQNTPAGTENTSADDLLRLLALDVELAERKAMQVLLKKVPDPFQSEFDVSVSNIALIGKTKGLDTTEALSQLKTQNIQASEKLTDKTTLVCIGDTLNARQVAEIVKRKLPIALPQHLRDFLQRLEKPYLKDSDTDTKQNLSRLIRSTDETNIKLAAEIMRTGGIPDELFYHVLLLGFWRGTSHRVHFRTILEKYTTPEQYDFIKKNQKIGFYKTVDLLFKPSVFDTNKVAEAGLQVFALSDQERHHDAGIEYYRPFHHIVKRCFVAGGEPARLACKAQLQDNTLNIMFADDSYFGMFKLPKELLEFEQIERIVCAQNVITQMSSNRKLLKQMKGLKELVLYHYAEGQSYNGQRHFAYFQKILAAAKQGLPHLTFTLRTF
ncbi:MAG: hypothetical protein MUD08_02280 [Cytophagales bacterium]|jgi:hypothetical protein|nr:hypothetical protein [Cytophagales bacterium]